jgi:hypothetical protein
MDAPWVYSVNCLRLDKTIFNTFAKLGCWQNISLHLPGLHSVQNWILCLDLSETCQPLAKYPAATGQSMHTTRSENIMLNGVQGNSYFFGHLRDLLKEPAGLTWRTWVDEVPNDGIIKIFALFQQERLVVIRYDSVTCWSWPRYFMLLMLLLVTFSIFSSAEGDLGLPADRYRSPAAIADVLVHKCYDFEKPAIFKRTAVKILGNGILFAEGDVHKQQRKILNPAFGFRHTKELFPMFWDQSLRLMKALEEQGEQTETTTDNYVTVEVNAWASKATLSIIEEAAMGVDLHSIEDPKEPLNLTYRTLTNPGRLNKFIQFLGLFVPGWIVNNFPIPLNQAIKRNTSLIMDICEAQKKLIESPEQDTKVQSSTVIATLVKSELFTTPELMEQMKTFLVAGHETTATALTWAIYLLTQHPDMQKRSVGPFPGYLF